MVAIPPNRHRTWRATAIPYIGAPPITVPDPTGTAAAAVTSTATARKVAVQGGRCGAVFAPRSSKRVATPLGTVGFAATTAGTAKKVAAQGGRTTAGCATVSITPVLSPFTYVTVVRDYDLADGSSPVGEVFFTPSEWLLNNHVTVAPAAVAVALDAQGKISISLVANNNSGTTPTGSYYTVCEEIIGQPRRCYKVIIPCDQTMLDLGVLEAIYPAIPTGGYGTSGYGTGGYGL